MIAVGHAARNRPWTISLARILLGVVAVSHLVIPLVMVIERGAIEHDIRVRNPRLDADGVDKSVAIALWAAGVFHGILLILSIVLLVLLPSLRSWVLRLAVVSQLISIVFSVVSWRSTAMFHTVIPVLDVIQLGIAICCIAAWRGQRPHERRKATRRRRSR